MLCIRTHTGKGYGVPLHHRRNNHRDQGRLVPQLLGWGKPTMAAVFEKQEISQQVVTRMQDLASEFSKIFWGWYPRTLRGRGQPPPVPNTQPGHRGAQAPRCWDLNLGPPQLFSRGCAPALHTPNPGLALL